MKTPDPRTPEVVVSVIVPTYNHAEHVLGSLESVFGQSFGHYELIVVNDGSPDGTASVLRPLDEAGRILYFEQANAGQAAARNRGLAAARGEFVAFLDDDDRWTPDNLAAQTRVLRDAGPDAVACVGQCRFVGAAAATDPAPVTDAALTFGRLLHKNPVISPGQVLIRRAALAAVDGFGAVRGGADDWDCWLRLARRGRLVANPRLSLLYQIHASNASLDAVAMLRSATAVIARHTADLPPGERRGAFASLLDQAAVFVAHQTLRAARRGRLATVWRAWRLLGGCLRRAGWRAAGWKTVAGAFWDAGGSALRAARRRRNPA